MAVKIVRQPKKIALIGAPTSAAALRGGHEKAPAALREAGLIARLQEAGFEVTDLGDCLQAVFQTDDEHPRARNVAALVKSLNDLRPRVEAAVKSGALPLVVGGDCSIALATIGGARRYYRQVNLVYMDGDADLNVPASTPSGIVDGMVVSHIVGRGAPELVRYWGEPPLVREADVALFGYSRLDQPEEAALARSPIRKFRAEDVRRAGPAAAARSAIQQLHAGKYEFVLHFDVDAISDFTATNFPGGGLSLSEVRDALSAFVSEPNVAVFEVTCYNPELDSNGANAKILVDLIASVFAARADAADKRAAAAAAASTATAAPPTPAPSTGDATPASAEAVPPTPSLEERETPASSGTAPAHSNVESPSEPESAANSVETVSDQQEHSAASSIENPPEHSGETDSAE